MQKTVHFRQVDWINQHENLVDRLRTTLQTRANIAATVHNVGSELCEVRHRHIAANEIRLHLVTYVIGATKGVRENLAGQAVADVLEANPPQNTEFVEREVALVAREHTLGFVAGGHVVGHTVEQSLRSLMALHHPADVANRLLLPARVDPGMLAQLIENGVDQLDLKVALPAPEAEAAGVGAPQGLSDTIGRAVWDALSTRFREDHIDDEIDALANATTHVGIHIGKRASVEEIDALTQLASDAVESGDEFTIRNRSGTIFTRDKLSLKRSYRQEGGGSTLRVAQAWQQIAQFLDEVG